MSHGKAKNAGHGRRTPQFHAPATAVVILFIIEDTGLLDGFFRDRRIGINTKNTFFDPPPPQARADIPRKRATGCFEKITRFDRENVHAKRGTHGGDHGDLFLMTVSEDLSFGIQGIYGIDHKVGASFDNALHRFFGRKRVHQIDPAMGIDLGDTLAGSLRLELPEIGSNGKEVTVKVGCWLVADGCVVSRLNIIAFSNLSLIFSVI